MFRKSKYGLDEGINDSTDAKCYVTLKNELEKYGISLLDYTPVTNKAMNKRGEEMIYITGDTHGDFGRFQKSKLACLPSKLNKEDYIIVTGDFGLLWSERQIDETAFWIDLLKKQLATILWVTGNHENYDLISAYPVTEWNGGKVRHIVKNKIILLERSSI